MSAKFHHPTKYRQVKAKLKYQKAGESTEYLPSIPLFKAVGGGLEPPRSS
jgi:hypothetical protein